MAKFCMNCGAALTGSKFCGECGTAVGETGEVQQGQKQWVLNGVNIDVAHVVLKCGKSKIEAARYLRELTRADYSECVRVANQIYTDTGVLNQVAQKIQQEPLNDDVVRCPKCKSSSISIVKNGYGFGKGFLGAVVLGPLGLLAGGMGSKKIKRTCISCGHKF